MTAYERARDEYIAALRADQAAELDGSWSRTIGARRIAATREFHRLEDPWTVCRCHVCAEVG